MVPVCGLSCIACYRALDYVDVLSLIMESGVVSKNKLVSKRSKIVIIFSLFRNEALQLIQIGLEVPKLLQKRKMSNIR